jgi:hypothetical protein
MRPLKYVFALIVLSLCFISVTTTAKKIEGYYIASPSGQKIKTTFLIPFGFFSGEPNYERMQTGIRCIDGAEKFRLMPDEASEVSFTYGGITVLIRSVRNDLSGGDQMFLHVVVDGPLSLYHYYESYYSPGSFSPGTGMSTGGGKQTTLRLILQRDGNEMFKVRRLFFKKDLTEFFSDCPALLPKINASGVSDLPALVKNYNETCL